MFFHLQAPNQFDPKDFQFALATHKHTYDNACLPFFSYIYNNLFIETNAFTFFMLVFKISLSSAKDIKHNYLLSLFPSRLSFSLDLYFLTPEYLPRYVGPSLFCFLTTPSTFFCFLLPDWLHLHKNICCLYKVQHNCPTVFGCYNKIP